MYVCVCHGITDRQIRRAVEQGACSLGEVQMKLPVGGCCGRCEGTARELIREHAEQAAQRAGEAYGAETAYAGA
jgi:bacterioferritin-associated ferredoxin